MHLWSDAMGGAIPAQRFTRWTVAPSPATDPLIGPATRAESKAKPQH